MTEDTKMDLQSMDIAAEKRQQLKQLFPEVFSEDRVDIDALRRVLGDFVEGGKERFGLNWPGKAECMKVIQAPSVATLKPCRDESVNFDDTENLFIEGDNLEVLKLLQKSYFGKIKMIYADPPYNTGKEFIYPDKYEENLDTYLAYTGQIDVEGKKFTTNTDSAGRYHTNWLNMIYPRIYLAKNLLKEDGILMISIDDNEYDNLKKACDEIFGEEHLLGTLLWKRRQNADSRNFSNVSPDHEFILVYAKSLNARFKGKDIDISKYKNPDNDPRGPWASIDLSGLATADQRPNLHYDITDPDTGNSFPPNPNRGWSKSRENVDKMILEGRILFPKTPTGRPREKKFLKDLNNTVTGFSTWLDNNSVGYTTHGTREVTKILEGKIFDFPKPTDLLRTLLDQVTGTDDIVLDFFAGSGSTAHATIVQNLTDNGNRKFILVQIPEPTDETSEAYKNGYKNIADIGKERIRRVGKYIQNENETQLSFDNAVPLDTGMKVLKLSESNFQVWNGDPEAFDETGKQLEMHIDHVDEAASAEDILYELLLKAGFELTTKIETVEFAGKEVFSIAEGALLICLEKEITTDLIDAMAEADPFQVICLDEAFHGNDQLKTNAVQTFAARAAAQESEIVFRTV